MIAFPPPVTGGRVDLVDLCDWLRDEADANDAALESVGSTAETDPEDWSTGRVYRELADELEGLL